MTIKPILIVTGEPYSIFFELLFKLYKLKIVKNNKRPLILITSKNLLVKQMIYFNYNFKINLITEKKINNKILNNKKINIIDIDFKFKKTFDKISYKSKSFILDSFKIALRILKNKKAIGMINGPISKKHFLNKKHLGITEFLAKKTNSKKNPVMLIYNPSFSVCPVTTHMPIKNVSKNLSTNKILNCVFEIQKFYKSNFKLNPKFAVLSLNPHGETINKFSEEDKIIKPAIKKLLKKRIKVNGPFSADTFFSKKNIKKFDVAVGMYHDQVLTPMKTLYNFSAINLTLGLPFFRVSPDHGTNNEMLGKNTSDPKSLFSSIDFFKNLKAR